MPDEIKPDIVPNPDESAAKIKAAEDKASALQKELDELKAKQSKEDETLGDKAKRERDELDKSRQSERDMESALKFNLTSAEFIKNNKSVLPNNIEDLIKHSEKEKYDSQKQKADALKSEIIVAYFEVQANLDYLTVSQKAAVDDYLKMTKNGKESKANHLWESIFEPTIEMAKRVKKAEEISRAKQGYGSHTDTETAYKERLMTGSRKHYLGEKNQ